MPRRGENIYKRKDGRWEARYLKSHDNGKAQYISIYAKTYKEMTSRLHFGQYSGKFSSTVLSQILILVLLLQLGHNSHSFFFILCFSSDNRISMDNYIYNSRSFHRLVETITHAPTMSTVKTM